MRRYHIQFELGQGSMAKVYAAHDSVMDREVALKVLHDAAAANENVRQRFLREARIAAGLSHPNLVTVHDAGEEDGKLYLVMELIEGESLDHALRQSSRPLRELVGVLEQAARGVHHAHQKGAVHRDLKPANILLPKSAPPKVTDFGLAHLMQSDSPLSRSGVPLGTPVYMAPEQARGLNDRITARTDVYALGAILYEILTRRPPFDGKTVIEIYRKIIRQPVLPPRRPGAAVPEPLERICLKALEKSPDRRYATAEEFADDLAAWLAGRQVKARPASSLRRSRRPWILIPVVLAAGIATAIFLSRGRGAPPPAPPAAAITPGPSDLLGVLRAQAGDLLATLDAHSHGARPSGLEAALAKAELLAEPHASTPAGMAWRAHVRSLAGRGGEPSGTLATDPAARPLLVRDRISTYARGLHISNVSFGATGFNVTDLAETPEMVRARQEALQFSPPAGALRAVADGLAHLGRQEYAAAADRLSSAEDPMVADLVRWIRACALLFAEKPADAEPDFEALAARGWPGAVFHSGICRMCLGAHAVANRADGIPDLRVAVERFTRRLEAGGDEATPLQYRAVSRLWIGNAMLARNQDPRPEFAAGLADVERILAAHPDLRNSWVTRGNIHQVRADACAARRLDDPDADYRAAIESFGRAMRLAPNDVNAVYARGGAYIRLGNWEWQRQQNPMNSYMAAVQDLLAAARLSPKPADIYVHSAQVRQTVARFLSSQNQDYLPPLKDAIQDLRNATAAEPGHVEALTLATELLTEYGDGERAAGRDGVPFYHEAVKTAAQAISLKPRNPKALTYLGNAQQRLANYGEADDAARRNRLQESFGSFEQALAADPGFWNAMTGKATILEALGQPDEAILWYEKALLTGKDNAHCQNFCKAALQRLKNRGD